MKKLLLSIVTLLALNVWVQAQQQLANGGFESWDTIGDYTQPGSWYSLNPLVQFGFDPCTLITSDAHSGDYAVLLESKTSQSSDFPGLICTGPILDAMMNPDFEHLKIAFASKPDRVRFYYKSFPKPHDTCIFAMVLTRWNISLQKTDTIAMASKMMYDSVGVYTLADLALNYRSPLPPDSAAVIVSSSRDGFNPVPGSRMQIDDIELVYTSTGINEADKLNLGIYPNPARNIVIVDPGQYSKITVDVYDQSGRSISQSLVSLTDRSIDVSALQNGIYLMVLHTENGAKQHSKLIIQH